MNEHIGILGGSFNPVHFGHLNLAIEMLEKRKLTKIYFCPANLNPFKINEPATPAHHRLQMLELAIKEIPEFFILKNELSRPPPSYTIDTIKEVLANESKAEANYYLILGEDAILNLSSWKNPHEIIRLTKLLIGIRSGYTPRDICEDKEIAEAILAGLTPTKTIDISSTEIRERILRNKYCGHLLPEKVLEYIHANSLQKYWTTSNK